MAKLSIGLSLLLPLLTLVPDLPESSAFDQFDHCIAEDYYKSWVYLRKKRNGPTIAHLLSSGFLDLRYRSRMVLCIHGPVVLYSRVEKMDPNSRLTSKADKSKATLQGAPDARFPSPDHSITDIDAGEEELRFTGGELVLFQKECISINKVEPKFLKKMKEDQGLQKPEIMSDTPVQGRLVLRIYLLANKEGMQKPEMAWFKGSNFDYIKSSDKTVKDASFIMQGSNMNHCLRLPDGSNLKLGFKTTSKVEPFLDICRWTVKEEDKSWYSKLFQRGFDGNGVRNGEPTLEEGDYQFYECPDSDDANIILQMSKTTPEPVGHTNFTEFDPFSLFNPNMWTPHGYRRDSNGLSGGDERYEDKAISSGAASGGSEVSACSLDPMNPTCMDSGEMDMTTLKDLQNVDPTAGNFYEIHAEDCLRFVSHNDSWSKKECLGQRDLGQRLLELYLELDPAFVPEDALKKPVAELTGDELLKLLPNISWFKSLQDNDTLAWKHDLLYLISDIFSDLCMPFRPEVPYGIARIFGWYLFKAHLFGKMMGRDGPPATGVFDTPLNFEFDPVAGKNDPWPILLQELQRCKGVAKNENGGKGLKFQWEVGDDTGRWKIPTTDELQGKSRRKRSQGATKRPIKPVYQPQRKIQKRSMRWEDEAIEEIDAETGEKILSRQKRASHYKVNGSAISTKYILPGKSLTAVHSEGTAGYVREAIQEYRKKPDLNDPRADSAKYTDLPENLQHCWNPQEDPMTKQIVCSKTEDIFFYEERAELMFDFNMAIDLWWKIWSTVIGYCNKAYHSRKSETFPRLYSAGFEYFFGLVQKEWRQGKDRSNMRTILSEFLTEESEIWMNACMEAAYINSNSQSFRPPRPMMININGTETANFFEAVPSYIYYRYHLEPSVAI